MPAKKTNPDQRAVIQIDPRKGRELLLRAAAAALRGGIEFLSANLPNAHRVQRPRSRAGSASRLVGYQEAAKLLAIPIGTLRSMVCRRQIPHVRMSPRIVVFDVAALEAWLAVRSVPGATNELTPRDA